MQSLWQWWPSVQSSRGGGQAWVTEGDRRGQHGGAAGRVPEAGKHRSSMPLLSGTALANSRPARETLQQDLHGTGGHLHGDLCLAEGAQLVPVTWLSELSGQPYGASGVRLCSSAAWVPVTQVLCCLSFPSLGAQVPGARLGGPG